MNVLVATDGAPESLSALSHLSELVPTSAHVRVVASRAIPFTPEAAAEVVEAGLKVLEAQGYRPTPVVLEGEAAAAILAYLATHPMDLVVVGAHARTSLLDVPLTSVAHRLAQQAPCSVLITRAP